MITFLDGPAAGITLMLKRAPVMLRAVTSAPGIWDALDQPTDEPQRLEVVHVYRLKARATFMHIKACRRSQSGWFASGEYEYLAEQPDPASVRSTSDWQRWCDENKQRVMPEWYRRARGGLG